MKHRDISNYFGSNAVNNILHNSDFFVDMDGSYRIVFNLYIPKYLYERFSKFRKNMSKHLLHLSYYEYSISRTCVIFTAEDMYNEIDFVEKCHNMAEKFISDIKNLYINIIDCIKYKDEDYFNNLLLSSWDKY